MVKLLLFCAFKTDHFVVFVDFHWDQTALDWGTRLISDIWQTVASQRTKRLDMSIEAKPSVDRSLVIANHHF
jgi:hypothetical protein